MKTLLLLIVLIENIIHIQGFNDKENSNNTRRWTPEDKTRIVMESLTTNITVAELCRKYNLNPKLLYNWKQEFVEGDKIAL